MIFLLHGPYNPTKKHFLCKFTIRNWEQKSRFPYKLQTAKKKKDAYMHLFCIPTKQFVELGTTHLKKIRITFLSAQFRSSLNFYKLINWGHQTKNSSRNLIFCAMTLKKTFTTKGQINVFAYRNQVLDTPTEAHINS